MLDYNEIKKGKIIIYENEPYTILDNHVARTQQRKPQNQVKMRSLISGRGVNTVFHASDTVEEADIINPADRFKLDESLVSETKKWLKDNTEVEAMIFDFEDEERTIGIKLPIKMEYIIKEAPPAIKGNSANSGNKRVTLEN